MSVCLVVLGIVGQWCYSGTENILVGECTEMGADSYLCVAQAESLPVFLSYYDPAICDEHPTNCFGDGSRFANGELVTEERYGDTAACPVDWVGETIAVPDVGDFVCRDTGGRIHPMYREVWVSGENGMSLEWQWVIVLDILWHHQPDNYPWWAYQTHAWQMREG